MTANDSNMKQVLKELFIPEQQKPEPVYFYGRVIVYLFFLVWGFRLMKTPMNDQMMSFMHNINLPMHEAGHIIFSFLGNFMGVLGGTLMQLIMPAIVTGAFLLKNRDAFGASLGLWWLGQSFMDNAPYINDARAGELPLLGGVTGKEAPGYHDWENILGRLGWLQYDHLLATISFTLGIVLMLLALTWGGYMLYVQFQANRKAHE
jgi:hypothetical protein